jgi:hypothetical protein
MSSEHDKVHSVTNATTFPNLATLAVVESLAETIVV